jgi:hypothetical protein
MTTEKHMKHQTIDGEQSSAPRVRDRSRARKRTGPVIALLSAGALGMRAALKKHNDSLHAAARALDETVSAPGSHDDALPAGGDESTSHASGHRHVPPPAPRTSARLSHRAWRRWALRADRTNHPPRA